MNHPPTVEEVLSINPTPNQVASPPLSTQKKTSLGWVIFWLIGLTPVGWYMVWARTTWPIWVKITVIIVTALLVIGLAIETELISTQVAGSLQGASGLTF